MEIVKVDSYEEGDKKDLRVLTGIFKEEMRTNEIEIKTSDN